MADDRFPWRSMRIAYSGLPKQAPPRATMEIKPWPLDMQHCMLLAYAKQWNVDPDIVEEITNADLQIPDIIQLLNYKVMMYLCKQQTPSPTIVHRETMRVPLDEWLNAVSKLQEGFATGSIDMFITRDN